MKELLSEKAKELSEDVMELMTEKLKVPTEWIAEAKVRFQNGNLVIDSTESPYAEMNLDAVGRKLRTISPLNMGPE